MAREITLGLVQMDTVLMDKRVNVQKALNYIEEAAKQNVNLICFPELFSTGYNPTLIGGQFVELAEPADGETFKELSAAAGKHKMWVIAPIALTSKVAGVLYNGLILIDSKGRLAGTYRKTHVWAGEGVYFRAGSEYPVFDTEYGKLGLMICYDGGFPEVSRILALNGAELILCPSAFPIWDKDMWDIYFQSRALENGCFVAGINRVGKEGEISMFGNNKVYGPRGKLLAEAGVDNEELLVCTVDLEQCAHVRANEVVYLRDRRAATYGRLCEEYDFQ